jgi:hypothetical protein
VPQGPIAEEHHVARHCQPGALREDGSPGPAAFTCDDIDGISCHWLEYFPGDRAAQLSQVRAALAARRTVRKTHKLALLQVGVARARALENLRLQIAIVRDPRPAEDGKSPDPSHALIEQVSETFRVALGDTLSGCVQQVVSAKE